MLASAGKEAIMPDFRKALRQDVHQEAADEFLCGKCHHFPTAAVPVVPPFERNLSALQTQNAVVGNGDPVGIAPEVLH